MFKKNPAKEQTWKEKLEDFERSGLSAAKWCERHHEKIHTLKYEYVPFLVGTHAAP